jgi:hypothetical protein
MTLISVVWSHSCISVPASFIFFLFWWLHVQGCKLNSIFIEYVFANFIQEIQLPLLIFVFILVDVLSEEIHKKVHIFGCFGNFISLLVC